MKEENKKEIVRRVKVVASKLEARIDKLKDYEIKSDVEWITDYGKLLEPHTSSHD